jgi:hypothetical protein
LGFIYWRIKGIGALETHVLFIYRYIELRPTCRAFDGFEFALRWQCCERLLLAGKKADRTWKRFMRPEVMPPINEPLDVHSRSAGRFQMVHKDVEKCGVLHRDLRRAVMAS